VYKEDRTQTYRTYDPKLMTQDCPKEHPNKG